MIFKLLNLWWFVIAEFAVYCELSTVLYAYHMQTSPKKKKIFSKVSTIENERLD